MKKVLSLLVIILFAAGISNAQGKMGIGITAGASIGMGDFGTAYGTGFGGDGTFMYMVGRNLDVTGSAGYHTWSKNSASFHTIPVLIGLRYYVGNGKVMPYLAAKAGMYFSSSTVDVPSYTIGGITVGGGSVSASTSDFGFLGGVGVLFPAGRNLDIDVNAGYNLITTSGSSTGYIDINGGVRIGLK